MEFGKLKDISEVELSLPADHASVAKVLGGKRAKNVQVYVGAPVWAEEGFVGKIYPPSAKEKDYVRHYAKQFNCIELNATHYRIPPEATIKRWKEAATPGFKYCPKLHQSISHTSDISRTQPIMDEFYKSLSGLGEFLGMAFLQMPPNFAPAHLHFLLDFLDHCPLRQLAIELRHEDWFSGAPELNQLCNYLYKNNMALVITDVAGRRDVLHQRLSNKTAFIRFTANDLHPSDFERMKVWVDRLAQWIDLGLEELYFFVHTPDKSLTPELAIYFIQHFNRATGLKLKAPKIRDEGPATLF